MIRYALICDCGHAFEAWFASSESFDEQARAGLVECPACGGAKVRKQLMAPAVARGGAPGAKARMVREMVRKLHQAVRETADYVGPRFAEEARARHVKKDARPVWGEARAEEVKELAEEGIEVLPLPPLPDEKN